MSAITDSRPINLDDIEARRERAWLDGDEAATRALIANDVPDMLAHLREANRPATATERLVTGMVREVAGAHAANALALDGWKPLTAFPHGENHVYVMVWQPNAPAGFDGRDWQAWDDLREQYATEHGKALRAGMERDELAKQLEAVGAERDRLAEQVRRVDAATTDPTRPDTSLPHGQKIQVGIIRAALYGDGAP
jgi:hypothetical protein